MDTNDTANTPPTQAEIDLLSAYHSGMIAGMGETRNWLASISQKVLPVRVAWRLANGVFENSRHKLSEMDAPRNHVIREKCDDIEKRIEWHHKVVDLNTFRQRETQRVQNGG